MQSILSQALQSELDNAPVLTATFVLGGHSFNVGSKPLTSADFTQINKGLRVSFQTDPTQFDGQINMLILKTRIVDDEGNLGEKAFSVADRPKLQRTSVEKVSTMFQDLFGSQLTLDDEADGEEGDGDTTKGNS